MAKYSISQDILDAILPLSEISSESFLVLLSELNENLAVSLMIEDDLEKAILATSVLDPRSKDERRKISEALIGVHYLRLSTGQNDEEFVQDIESAYEIKDNSRPLISNIRNLLDLKVLRASTKAWSLMGDHERGYLGGRILTDIRPVLDKDISEPFLASLVIHSLKLSMRVDGRQQNIYIAADSEDLRQLRDAIDRAIEKTKSIICKINNHAAGEFGATTEE